MFQFLQHQHTGALPHHKAVPFPVKGDGSPQGVCSFRQCPHGGKTTDGHGGDGRLTAAAEHHFGIAIPDLPEGITHRVGTSGAGRDYAGTHALQSIADG